MRAWRVHRIPSPAGFAASSAYEKRERAEEVAVRLRSAARTMGWKHGYEVREEELPRWDRGAFSKRLRMRFVLLGDNDEQTDLDAVGPKEWPQKS